MSDYDKIKKGLNKVKEELKKFDKEQREFRNKHTLLMMPYDLQAFKNQCEQRRLEKEINK